MIRNGEMMEIPYDYQGNLSLKDNIQGSDNVQNAWIVLKGTGVLQDNLKICHQKIVKGADALPFKN